MLTVGSLFTGIGGIELGLERAGMRTLWQCESDDACRRVLTAHWPSVITYRDVRELGRSIHPWTDVDVLTGGFPCPVVSQAARGRNVAEWMWPEFARVIRLVRPRYVIVENAEGLRYAGRGFDQILGDMAECGFDATWRVLRASDFGAPHHRARVWLVGYPHGDREPDLSVDAEASGVPQLRGAVRRWPDPPGGVGVDDGIPADMDRLRLLGNAVVVPVAEHVGRAVMNVASERTAA